MKKYGFKVDSDLRNEKIGLKIREHTLQKIPFLLVVGEREAQKGTVSVRRLDGEDLGSMTVENFSKHLRADVLARK